jgi:hypothetical protein
MKFQSDETKLANEQTAFITQDLNSANLNFYDAHSYTPQHSDDEVLFKTPDVSPEGETSIVSINMGASKIFAAKNKETNEEIHVALENGDILYMEGTTQKHTTHQVFSNHTHPSQFPNLYGYPTMEEFGKYEGTRLNITGRCIHTHTKECPMFKHNPETALWSNNYPTSPNSNYLPKHCPEPSNSSTAPADPAADPAVDIPVPEVATSSDIAEL